LNVYSFYTAANFVVTCSTSDNDKALFPNGTSLNHFFLGLYIFVFFFWF
jgi:hypothetical protein